MFAFLQTLRHAACIAYDYWDAARNASRFDPWEFIRRDLARPFFEPDGFCGAWVHYSGGQSAALAWDLPAYAAGVSLRMLVTHHDGCADALTTPRGQILAVAFVPFVWLLVGMTIRRLTQRRWRPPAANRITAAVLSLGLVIPGFFGALLLVPMMVGVLADLNLALRSAGTAFWLIYIGALSAERLRVWPFANVKPGLTP